MKLALKARLEAWWIRVAIRILNGRNVTRCMVVSRRDNNEMWGMAESLEGIERRIRTGYNDVSGNEQG
jgi:hypothetical protein